MNSRLQTYSVLLDAALKEIESNMKSNYVPVPNDYVSQIIQKCDKIFVSLVQNKHSTRSGYEASEAMLIFVIMGGQWMDGFFGEPSARAVNSPPPFCYKDSIEQVAPAMPRACHEPN